ncbi:TIGR02270 family protein [Variovorax sp. J22R133]|uniref:TIGR02270 family protein n=1 Tax=Variovorax brevis TaxID=3053503 RepID=UPI002578D8AA|nr:TIGR02270 family protein [Variovorax sp. J22R133]MDM0117228.1 TIGR02270 family protein [Variovorax sp. J22R133]
MSTSLRPPIAAVVRQHLEDVCVLRSTRAVLVRAPHVQLHRLRRLDDRLAANLDGLAVAGEFALDICRSELATPNRGALFVNGIAAIEHRDPAFLGKLLALAETVPHARSGLVSAFGWQQAASLGDIALALLNSPRVFSRDVGLTVCAMHKADPGGALATALADGQNPLHALAAAGRLGRVDLATACVDYVRHDDARCRLEAATAALLLGDRQAAVQALVEFVQANGHHRAVAAALVLKVLSGKEARSLLRTLAQDKASARVLIRGIGVAGDSHYVPWLIEQMQDLKLTRLAGEAFSLVTGLDLALLDLERKPPEGSELGPTDDAADEDVDMDEDDGLPWPDARKIGDWWTANGHQFTPGVQYFMGKPPSASHCLSVLRNGFQRQRKAAATYLCLLKPGTPLFNTAAPAWRQKRWLDAMQA